MRIQTISLSSLLEVFTPDIIDNHDEGLGRLHAWRVKLEGDEKSLAAEQLNSIPYGYAFMNSFALGRRLIVCAMSSLVGPSWIEVIWWEQCSVTSDMRTRFFTGCEQIVCGTWQA